MKFNYVKFKNFGSFGNEIHTIDLSESGITLVTGINLKDPGSNGSGKSLAIVESVVYALFGQTTKKLKAEEIVNNKIKKDCFVEISFSISNDNYLIRRYRQHREFDNALIFEKNTVNISAEKLRETQALIESTMKISFKSFILSVVLSQEKMAGFAENDPIDRRKIIENLLMYDFISKYHKASKEIIRTIRPEVEALRRTYNDKKEVIKTLTSNLLNYVERWELGEQEKSDRIEELEEQLKSWKAVDLIEEVKIRVSLKKKKAEKEDFVVKKESHEEALSEANRDIKKLKPKLTTKEEEIDEISKDPESCPVCQNKIDYKLFQAYLQKRIDEKDELEGLLSVQIVNINNLKNKIERYKGKIKIKTNSINSLNEKITLVLNDKDIQNLQEKISNAESEIKILQSQIVANIESDIYIIDTQAKVDGIKSNCKKMRKKIQRLEREQVHYEWWKEALGNSPSSIKSFCVNHVLQSLNKYINYYLEFFGFDISYSLNAELEDLIIKDDEEVSFNQLSGGEKRSVEISLVFSLYEIVRLKLPDNINIIVLDEILSNYLDDIRITGVLEILSEFEGRGLSVFVIDHKNFIKENLDCKSIVVTKNKLGFSSLDISQ